VQAHLSYRYYGSPFLCLKDRHFSFTGSPPFLIHLLASLNFLLRKRLTYRCGEGLPVHRSFLWLKETDGHRPEYSKTLGGLSLVHSARMFLESDISMINASCFRSPNAPIPPGQNAPLDCPAWRDNSVSPL
jgi:hypothetical protein